MRLRTACCPVESLANINMQCTLYSQCIMQLPAFFSKKLKIPSIRSAKTRKRFKKIERKLILGSRLLDANVGFFVLSALISGFTK